MKPSMNPLKSASWQYGLGVAKAFAGIAMAFTGLIMLAVAAGLLRNHYTTYIVFQIIQLGMITGGGFLMYNGFTLCRLSGNYRKLSAAMEYKNREDVRTLASVTGQSLTRFLRDLQRMSKRGFFPDYRIDCGRREFVMNPDNLPEPVYKDGDTYFVESVRPSFKPFIALPAVFVGYAALRPFGQWYDAAVAGILAVTVTCLAAAKTPSVTMLKEKRYKAPPPPEPVAISTGNEALDGFLTASMGYLGELNELTLSITGEKMLLPVGELLNITRQIFAFVEKNPEKIRQIRGFMNYYLPTTIKLLKSYRDFSRQPLKGDNIKESLAKIEGSMDGIVETFRRELDNLYSDKALDITVDIDMMLAMMRQQGMGDNGGMDKTDEL